MDLNQCVYVSQSGVADCLVTLHCLLCVRASTTEDYEDNQVEDKSTVKKKQRRVSNNNNNNDFFCANILEGQAHWRDKTKGLSKLVIENSA